MSAIRVVNRGLARVEAWNPQRDETRSLAPGRHGVRLRVEQGVVLVTQAGDSEDHVLGPGEELRIHGPGLGVAWALEPSSAVVIWDRSGGEDPPEDEAPRAA